MRNGPAFARSGRPAPAAHPTSSAPQQPIRWLRLSALPMRKERLLPGPGCELPRSVTSSPHASWLLTGSLARSGPRRASDMAAVPPAWPLLAALATLPSAASERTGSPALVPGFAHSHENKPLQQHQPWAGKQENLQQEALERANQRKKGVGKVFMEGLPVLGATDWV